MSRRIVLLSAGAILGLIIVLLASHCDFLKAGDQRSSKTMSEQGLHVTPSDAQTKELLERIATLESRVKTLESYQGIQYNPMFPEVGPPLTFPDPPKGIIFVK